MTRYPKIEIKKDTKNFNLHIVSRKIKAFINSQGNKIYIPAVKRYLFKFENRLERIKIVRENISSLCEKRISKPKISDISRLKIKILICFVALSVNQILIIIPY